MEQGVFSVSSVNEYLRMMMDGDRVLSSLFVRGEISNYKLYSSGHAYFTLKDEEGQLKAVMFRSYASRLPFAPADGMRVIVHGRISVYGAGGQYQLYADEMQPDGAGSLALRFEQLKRKLEAEGLFAASRKRPLPPIPARIGVITSPTGAAIHDMINVIGRRFPAAEILLYPSLVQGTEAPAQLISGLQLFGLTGVVDVIILGRGGGSAEDLWAFNDEQLARAVADCPIPVISAVGHESDFTICDFVADRRAPTPSAAAELAVPDCRELQGVLLGMERRMQLQLKGYISQAEQRLAHCASAQVLRRPEQMLESYAMRQGMLEQRLVQAMQERMEKSDRRFCELTSQLRALDPLAVLSRGYATVSRPTGETVTRADQLSVAELIDIRFKDGSVRASVAERKSEI